MHMLRPAIRRLLAVGVSTVLLLTVVGAAPVAACNYGCTPGYWKNHTDSWGATYTPGMKLDSPFDFPGALAAYRDDTLIEALNYGGGPGVAGAARILLRAGVAALLNAQNLATFPFPPPPIIESVNWVLASGDRAYMIWYAAQLDTYNNLGCPLN